MRKETVGTGITARERTVYETNDRADMEAFLAEFDAWGDQVTAKGLWGASTAQMRAACEGILQGQPDRGQEPDSPSDFARKIVRSLELADHAILEGKAENAARLALDAGQLWTTAVMKWSWESSALSGEKGAKARAVGTAMLTGKYADHTPKVLSEMKRLKDSGQSVSSAARICAAQGLGSSASANLGLWNRHNKKAATRL